MQSPWRSEDVEIPESRLEVREPFCMGPLWSTDDEVDGFSIRFLFTVAYKLPSIGPCSCSTFDTRTLLIPSGGIPFSLISAERIKHHAVMDFGNFEFCKQKLIDIHIPVDRNLTKFEISVRNEFMAVKYMVKCPNMKQQLNFFRGQSMLVGTYKILKLQWTFVRPNKPTKQKALSRLQKLPVNDQKQFRWTQTTLIFKFTWILIEWLDQSSDSSIYDVARSSKSS